MPQKNVNNRAMYWPRGRVWGGSSSLNAMVYVRGHAEDYNRWEKEGAAGWNYASCLPYFKKAESHSPGGSEYRGGAGPLKVTRYGGQKVLDQAWLEAGQQAGYPFTEDMNGYQQEGIGYMDSTVHQGERWNTASAYLRPVLHRKVRPHYRVGQTSAGSVFRISQHSTTSSSPGSSSRGRKRWE